jgi:hypothetical protein
VTQIVGAQPDQAHGRTKIAHTRRERSGCHPGVLERAPPARGPQHRPLRWRIARGQVGPRRSQRISGQPVRVDLVHLRTVETQLARGQIKVGDLEASHFPHPQPVIE